MARAIGQAPAHLPAPDAQCCYSGLGRQHRAPAQPMKPACTRLVRQVSGTQPPPPSASESLGGNRR
eukprot:366086-Chlamydomonas_euryale.AAC.2